MGIGAGLMLSATSIGGGAVAGSIWGGEGGTLNGAMAGAQIAKPLVSLLGTLQDSKHEKQWAKFKNKQAKYDALANYSSAELQARSIREKAKAQIKGIGADTASSGVVVGSGADDEAAREELEAAEYDAQMTMYNAKDELSRAMLGIKVDKLQAKQKGEQQMFGYLGGLLDLGAAGATAYSKWKQMIKDGNGDGGDAGDAGSKPSIGGLNNKGVAVK